MFVKTLMMVKDDLFTVSPKDNISRALDIINSNNVMSIPVVEGEKFYGSISKDRIYEYYFEECKEKDCFFSDYIVENVMKKDVPKILPMADLEEASSYLVTNRTPFVAVIDTDEKFLGILTHKAIFKEFTNVLGLNKGKKLSVIAYDIKGQISKLSKIISDNGGDILSFAVIDTRLRTDVKEIVVRIKSKDFEDIVNKVKEAGFRLS